MATTNYLDLTGLQVYDGLIKNYVTNADAKALKDAIDKAKGVYDTADLNEVINAAIKELQAAEAAYIATSINEVNVNADAQSGEWFTTQGVRISKPTQKGIYIHNGKKIMINNK